MRVLNRNLLGWNHAERLHQVLIGLFSAFLMLCGAAPLLQASDQSAGFLNSLQAYRPSYFLNSWFMDHEGSDQGYQNQEIIIRLSVKVEIAKPFYFGYSHKAFWQVYDLSDSRPFREQNYNPELFVELGKALDFDDIQIGLIEHESNGDRNRYDENGNPVNFSRTWDRSYLFLAKQITENLSLSLKAWIVVSPEMEQYRSYYDDNPDMQQYMGSGELYLDLSAVGLSSRLMFRHGWKTGTETFQLDARIPLSLFWQQLDSGYAIHLQAFSGYGDSLIDYDRKITRMAVGIGLY